MTLSIDSKSTDTKSPRAQFGIGRLMVLTALVAVIMTIAVRINAPKIAQGLLAGYLILFALWVVMRGPSVIADLADVNKRRRQLQQRRSDLQREVMQLRQVRESQLPESKTTGS